MPTIDILEEQNLPHRGGLLPGCSRQSAATHLLSVVDTTVCSVRYTVFTAKMATQAGMKRSGSILEREYREYEDELSPPSNQEHGKAHAKLLAREKAAAEAAEAPT
jgi:hypothetical protein